MRKDLSHRLREDGGELKDLVLAGSGEPTSIPNLDDALRAIQNECAALRPTLPVKLFTNGRGLDRPAVNEPVGDFVQRGGQVWVKFDGASNETISLVNRRSFDAASHIDALWRFAKNHAIGLQTMLLRGPGLPDPARVADEITASVEEGLNLGAIISDVHILTLSRRPSEERMANVLTALSLGELEALAAKVRNTTGLRVSVYPA